MEMRQFIRWVETKIRELVNSNKEIDSMLALKQNILHAGNNIHIVQRPDGSYDIWVDDPNIFRTVQALPDAADAEENVIYLVPNPDQSDPENIFLQYIFHKDKPAGEEWKLIGGTGVSSAVTTQDSPTIAFTGLGTAGSPLTANVDFSTVPVGTSGIDNFIWFDSRYTGTLEDGSEQRPFKTIEAAIALADTKVWGTVIIPPATSISNITLTKTIRFTTMPYMQGNTGLYNLNDVKVDQGVFLYASGAKLGTGCGRSNPSNTTGGIALYSSALGANITTGDNGYWYFENVDFSNYTFIFNPTSYVSGNQIYIYNCTSINFESNNVNFYILGGHFKGSTGYPVPLRIGEITNNTTWVLNSIISSGNTNIPFTKIGWSGNRTTIWNCTFDYKTVFTNPDWPSMASYFSFDAQTEFMGTMFTSGNTKFLAGDGVFRTIDVPTTTYILEGGVYPTSPKIGDKVIVTSDGTSTGTFLLIYEWNMIEWELKNLRYNLSYSYKNITLPSVLPENYIFEGNSVKLAYDKNKNGGDQYILKFDQGPIYRLLNYVPNPDVKIEYLEIYQVDYDFSLDGEFVTGDETLSVYTSYPVDISIKNLHMESFFLSINGAKNILLDNLTMTTGSKDIFVQNFNTSCVIKNLNRVSQVYTISNFDNRDFVPTGTVQIELDNLTAEHYNPTKENVLSEINVGMFDENNAYPIECKFSNLGTVALNFKKAEVVDVTLNNFNAKWIERIQLYHNKITQVMIDKLFTDLIASGLGSSVTGTKTITLTQIEGGIAPSSAIQTQLTTLGYTININ